MTLPQELPDTAGIISGPISLEKELAPQLRENLTIKAGKYGSNVLMPGCDDGISVKFYVDISLGVYGENHLIPFVQALQDHSAVNRYFDTVNRHKAVGFGHNKNGDEIVFLMGERRDGQFYVLELINGIQFFAFTVKDPYDYPYYGG